MAFSPASTYHPGSNRMERPFLLSFPTPQGWTHFQEAFSLYRMTNQRFIRMRDQNSLFILAYFSPVSRSCFSARRVKKVSAEPCSCCSASKQQQIWKKEKMGQLQVRAWGQPAAVLVQEFAHKGLAQPLPMGYTHCQLGRKGTTTGNQNGEKTVLLYCLIGSQEVKLAPGHTTNILWPSSAVMQWGNESMKGKGRRGTGSKLFFANHINARSFAHFSVFWSKKSPVLSQGSGWLCWESVCQSHALGSK